MRSRAALGLPAILAAVAFTSLREGEPGTIAYATPAGDVSQLVTVRPDGGGRRVVVTARHRAFLGPVWSSDARRLVFGLGRGLLVVSARGGRWQHVTAGADSDPAVSPNGKWIAFVRTDSTGAAVYAVHLDGTGLRRIADDAASFGDLSWAPDSKRLAATLVPAGSAWAGCPQVAVLQLAGATNAVTHGCGLTPSWSPDGRRIAYVSTTAATRTIAVVSADGNSVGHVTPGPEDVDPLWSPDGGRIAFRHGRTLATARPDGTDLRVLTHTRDSADAPAGWSPDGRRILFERFDPVEDFGIGQLLVTDVTASAARRIARSVALGSASWSLR